MKHVEVVEGMWSVPNAILQDIFEGLTELAARRLETRENHDRVVSLLRGWFEDPMDRIRDSINAIIDEHPAPEGWEGTDLPIVVNEARMRAIVAYKKRPQLIKPIPEKALLKNTDMPKLMKEALGDRNQFGVGDIKRKLHFVYPMPIDTTADVVEDGKDGEPVPEVEG